MKVIHLTSNGSPEEKVRLMFQMLMLTLMIMMMEKMRLMMMIMMLMIIKGEVDVPDVRQGRQRQHRRKRDEWVSNWFDFIKMENFEKMKEKQHIFLKKLFVNLHPGWSASVTRCSEKTLTARPRTCSTWWTSGFLVPPFFNCICICIFQDSNVQHECSLILFVFEYSQGRRRDNHGTGVHSRLSRRRWTLAAAFHQNLT